MRWRHSFAVAIAGLLAAASFWLFSGGSDETAPSGYQTDLVSRGRIESVVNTAGMIEPVVTVEVGSELSGLISELHADFNSEVKSGQVIARIDDRTVRARLRQSEADVASAEANLSQQQANANRARADLDLAGTEVTRQRELIGRNLVSQSDLDKAEANLKIASAQLGVADAQVAAAAAAIAQREAQLEQTKLDLERTYVRSPVDGIVIDRQVDVGQTVAASFSAPTLFEIAQDLTKMQIEADVDEADIGQVAEGLPARFTVDAYPGQSFAGSVRQVRKAATITNNVVTYKVIIDAENGRKLLLPGMTANVDIVLGAKEGVLRVNNSALRFNPPGAAPSLGPGGPGGSIANRLPEIVEELQLSAEQREAVESAMAEMQTAMAETRGSVPAGPPGAGGPPSSVRERMVQLRQRMTNSLSGVLTAEQMARVDQLVGGPPVGPPGLSGRDTLEGMRPGQVWVLDAGKPKAVRVVTGLADSQYTEVASPEINEGDAVIVRLAR